VELRGFDPLTPCMPCHPRQFTRSSAALLSITCAPLTNLSTRSAVVRRKAACWITADKLLTGRSFRSDPRHADEAPIASCQRRPKLTLATVPFDWGSVFTRRRQEMAASDTEVTGTSTATSTWVAALTGRTLSSMCQRRPAQLRVGDEYLDLAVLDPNPSRPG